MISIKILALYCILQAAESGPAKRWRDDHQCGPSYPLPDGGPSECPGRCCSDTGWCGNSPQHCCVSCKDYRIKSGTISFPTQRTITRNMLLTTIPQLSRSFIVNFQLFPIRFQSGWSNIIHFTASGRNFDKYGDRVPGVWFHGASSRDTKNRLLICSAVNNDKSYCISSAKIVPRGAWSDVEISQRREGNSYKYQVKVRGVIASVINTAARAFTNVKVYAGDNFYNAAPGYIRALTVVPEADDLVTPGPNLGVTDWGTWSSYVTCPQQKMITGFRLQVEEQGQDDETALNGIEFRCQGDTTSGKIEHLWGTWTTWISCGGDGHVTELDLKAMSGVGGDVDDYGATNVRVKCSGGDERVGDGVFNGKWVGYRSCSSGTFICGARALIEENQGGGDDTALNRIQIACCPENNGDNNGYTKGSDGLLYKFHNVPVNWDTAKLNCEQEGAHLAIFTSPAIFEYIKSASTPHTGSIWVGGRRDVTSRDDWKWIDGTPVETKYWAIGEPNDVNDNEDCAVIRSNTNGLMFDIDCDRKEKFFCQKGNDVLTVGSTLSTGNQLTSPNGRYRCSMQDNGNLVVYAPDNRVLWKSNTANIKIKDGLKFQSDGNLVLYRSDGRVVWGSKTYGIKANPPNRLVMQNDGNLVLYGAYKAFWSTKTVQTTTAGTTADITKVTSTAPITMVSSTAATTAVTSTGDTTNVTSTVVTTAATSTGGSTMVAPITATTTITSTGGNSNEADTFFEVWKIVLLVCLPLLIIVIVMSLILVNSRLKRRRRRRMSNDDDPTQTVITETEEIPTSTPVPANKNAKENIVMFEKKKDEVVIKDGKAKRKWIERGEKEEDEHFVKQGLWRRRLSKLPLTALEQALDEDSAEHARNLALAFNFTALECKTLNAAKSGSTHHHDIFLSVLADSDRTIEEVSQAFDDLEMPGALDELEEIREDKTDFNQLTPLQVNRLSRFLIANAEASVVKSWSHVAEVLGLTDKVEAIRSTLTQGAKVSAGAFLLRCLKHKSTTALELLEKLKEVEKMNRDGVSVFSTKRIQEKLREIIEMETLKQDRRRKAPKDRL